MGADRTPVMNDLADRGARLFEYLAKAQTLRMSRIQDIAAYQRDGEVIWVADLPEHPAVSYQQADPGKPFLMVQKVTIGSAPEPDSQLGRWLDKAWDNPEREPGLRLTRNGEAGEVLRLDDHPEIRKAFGEWLPRWQEWAREALPKVAVRRLYQTMYEMYTRYGGATETLEAVLALGFLTWRNSEVGLVRRHVLTMPVVLGFDSDYGAISASIDPGVTGYTAELQEILDPSQMSAAGDLQRAETEARDGQIDPFDRENVGALVRMFINCINPDAVYADDIRPGDPVAHPTAGYAPAVILRKRGNRGMVTALRTIAETIRATGELPSGIHNLVDPNFEPVPAPTAGDGAIVRDGSDQFLPLQLNDVQLRILEHVDKHAHTLVQGPPGTGKTHTAAALITHLLAQGKRVLITAHTDRALHEVRAKLPEQIKPLSVAVVGDSRRELEDLKASVNRISHAADEHDPAAGAAAVAANDQAIALAREQRAAIQQELLTLRERDVTTHSVGGYTGTIADIALRWREARSEFGWLSELVVDEVEQDCPIAGELVTEWRTLLLDNSLDDPEVAAPDIVAATALPPADLFGQWCAAEQQAAQYRHGYAHYDADPAAARIAGLSGDERRRVCALLDELTDRLRHLSHRTEPWTATALADIHSGRDFEWRSRAAAVADLLTQADAVVAALGYATVQVTVDDPATLLGLAENLKSHIETHGALKLHPDGRPKTGLTAPRVVKLSEPLFEQVRIDGRIPVTVEQLTHFLNAQLGRRLLEQLDLAWPGGGQATAPGVLRDRVARHRAAFTVLAQVLDYAGRLDHTATCLRDLALPVPDWADPIGVRGAREAFDAVDAREVLDRAVVPLDELTRRLDALREDPRVTVTVDQLAVAAHDRDTAAYRQAHDRLAELNQLRRRLARRHEIDADLTALPLLRDAITADPVDPDWDARLAGFEMAWRWATVGRWLTTNNVGGVNELCRSLDNVEAELRELAAARAATTAWDLAVGRLTNRARADLRHYAQLVKRLGRGTGKYADRDRADIQRALGNCRAAVPVWIMPIYRVVEQFSVTADMFDVVVVDEASQAGAEAVFLQYLAPRIVVIGDDKQVSPSAVGVDAGELERLAKQYLYDDTYISSWHNPKHSLFDDASMRYPTKLTLIEHRRCVPEIIGFSNKIAYEDEGVPLLPVRRYGSDRLDPIRTVHVADGHEVSSQVNPAEADRIVEQIENCLADARYDGKSFGVISLLGTSQAKHITQKLVARIGPEEMQRRELHCGDAADFQGAERDVIFLSLVAAPGPDRRLAAQTTDSAAQRYNVAVSRARDQLWLYHSVTAEHLHNSADLRLRLLEYCQGIEARTHVDAEPPQRFSDDYLVEPFEYLFEQQVYNRIVDRGYRVTPHHTETGYDIDMVVTGGGGQLAVHCDGDHWNGPDQYREDLARQRDLERCGWPFHRIRLADFIVDPDACLEELWLLLEDQGIYPIGEEEQRRLAKLLAAAGPEPVEPASPELRERVSLVPVESVWTTEELVDSRLTVWLGSKEEADQSVGDDPAPSGLHREASTGYAEPPRTGELDAFAGDWTVPEASSLSANRPGDWGDDADSIPSSVEAPATGTVGGGTAEAALQMSETAEPVSESAASASAGSSGTGTYAAARGSSEIDSAPSIVAAALGNVPLAANGWAGSTDEFPERASRNGGAAVRNGETAANGHNGPVLDGRIDPVMAGHNGFADDHEPVAGPGGLESTANGAMPDGRRFVIESYVAFAEQLESPTIADHATIVGDFLRIVAVEGPVTAARLRAAYVASARTRERDHVRKKLDIALRAAVARGNLVVDNALELDDPALLTYRLPEQPASRWRGLGPRKVEQIPPLELAEVMAHQAERHGWSDRATLFRAVINAVGQTRLTDNTIAALALVVPLARRLGAND
ncbi:AAA domain-containing protein [Nocardia sp. NPDC059246]|uniref:AAA domain-containing protein n=1 Tax=unclassified Nocardia TaxID=2637762 RepID=UPI0036C7BC03